MGGMNKELLRNFCASLDYYVFPTDVHPADTEGYFLSGGWLAIRCNFHRTVGSLPAATTSHESLLP
jgi:hypothetical protein